MLQPGAQKPGKADVASVGTVGAWLGNPTWASGLKNGFITAIPECTTVSVTLWLYPTRNKPDEDLGASPYSAHKQGSGCHRLARDPEHQA